MTKSGENMPMENSGSYRSRMNKTVAVNRAEKVLGSMMVSVVTILTIFSCSLIQVFKVVPSNLVLVQSTIQLLLFTISNKTNSIKFIPVKKKEAIAAAVQGLLSGLALLCSVAAVRVIPLGDFFTIVFARSVFVMILISIITGRQICKKKSVLIIACIVGLIILVKNMTDPLDQESLDQVSPDHESLDQESLNQESLDQESTTWTSLGLICLFLLFSTLRDSIVIQSPQVPAGVVSFWSAVGGFVTCIPAFTSFYSEEHSILSGSPPSYMQGFLLVFLSLSTIASAIFTDQAEKLTSKTLVKVFRIWEIPLGFLISFSLPSQCIPNFNGLFGILLVVGSSVCAQQVLEGEEAKHATDQEYEAV